MVSRSYDVESQEQGIMDCFLKCGLGEEGAICVCLPEYGALC